MLNYKHQEDTVVENKKYCTFGSGWHQCFFVLPELVAE